MSGGSYQYAYSRLENDFLYDFSKQANTPERKAFLALLRKVAKAMHDIEWVDSGDYGPGDENKAIMECVTNLDVLKCHIEEAEKTVATLQRLIEQNRKEDA